MGPAAKAPASLPILHTGSLDFPVPLDRKTVLVTAEKRCFNCLSVRHSIERCDNRRPCRFCKGDHHSALCPKKPPSTISSAVSVSQPPTSSPTLVASAQVFGEIFVKTATIIIEGKNGPRRAICFIDRGSHRSSCASRPLAKRIQAQLRASHEGS